jgi:hypothetical protein
MGIFSVDQVRKSILVALLYIRLNKMDSHPPNFSECHGIFLHIKHKIQNYNGNLQGNSVEVYA